MNGKYGLPYYFGIFMYFLLWILSISNSLLKWYKIIFKELKYCWKSQEKKTVSLFIPSFLVFLVINLDISSLFQNMPGIASFWLKAKRLSVHQTSYFWILLLLTLNINCLPSMLWKINFQEALYQKSVFFKISRVCVGWGLCGCMLCLFTVYDFSSFLFSLQK